MNQALAESPSRQLVDEVSNADPYFCNALSKAASINLRLALYQSFQSRELGKVNVGIEVANALAAALELKLSDLVRLAE
jgi:hypothetical protein